MPNINTIENRDKEFKRIKGRIDEAKFDGIVNNDRTTFKKIINNMQDAFDLAVENDPRKSATWNYADIIQPINDKWRDIPYDKRPDEVDIDDFDTYLRIESLSTISRLIIINIFTESARDIFDDGCNEACPKNHRYIKVQYGMKALYEKYYQKSLFSGISLWEQKTAWYFDQTLEPLPQFRTLDQINLALKEMTLIESETIKTLQLYCQLKKNTLYEPVVIDIANSVKPGDDFFSKVNVEIIKDKIITFYGGVIFSQIKNFSETKLKTLRNESKNWMNNIVTTDYQIQEVNVASLQTTILALQQKVDLISVNTNNKFNNGDKSKCKICFRMHAGTCKYTEKDICGEIACLNKGVILATKRHVIGCKHFLPDKNLGLYCWVCATPRVMCSHNPNCKKAHAAYLEKAKKSPENDIV